MTLGQKISLARKSKGWTQGELGELVDVSSGLIGKYERGEINPPLEVAAKIAEVLDFSLDYLAGMTDENPVKTNESIPGQLKPLIAKLAQLSPADRAVITTVTDGLIAKAKLSGEHQPSHHEVILH
jgi:transcriptional regulator with XRE-family HTH domain